MQNVMSVIYGREKRLEGANWKCLKIDYCDCLLVLCSTAEGFFFLSVMYIYADVFQGGLRAGPLILLVKILNERFQ